MTAVREVLGAGAASDVPQRRSLTMLDVGIAVFALGVAAIVVADGSPEWRVFRGLAALALPTAVRSVHLRHRFGGIATFALGVVAIAFGLAFGVRYAAFGAWQWRTVVGLVELVNGLGLSVVGARRLTANRRRTRRVATAAALTLVAAMALMVIAPALMATNVPPIADRDTERISAILGARRVTFASADGVELGGWFVPSRNGAAVVVRHGAGRSTASGTVEHGEVLAAHGYGVLLTDARGHATSGGRAMDYGWYGGRDIAAAVTFLAAQPGVDAGRIGVLGLSMGGEEAIGSIGVDERIAAVVAEGATARTASDKAWLPDVYGWRGWLQRSLDTLQFGLTDLLTSAPRPESLAASAAAASPRPILLIAAGDVDDEAHAAAFIADSAGGNVDVWVVPRAGHTQAIAVDAAAWEQRVVSFLDDALTRNDR